MRVIGNLMSAMTLGDVVRAISARARSRLADLALQAGATLGDWNEQSVKHARAALQERIYGRVPTISGLRVASRRRLRSGRACKNAVVERWEIEDGDASDAPRFGLLLVLPSDAAPRAVVLAQVFSRGAAPLSRSERAIASEEGVLRPRSLADWALALILGRHIHAPPFARILEHGVAIAVFCPGELIPDHPLTSQAVLERLSGPADEERGGVLAHWAAMSIAVRALLADDERIGSAPIVAWGHSRHGKAALLAAAFDHRFAGVIAHQSGRFGASLTAGGAGETPAQIAKAYPHWFGAGFGEDRHRLTDIDQHHLLALIAPRPILLGNGRRDLWADPEGAFRAAHAASDAFIALGANGLLQTNLKEPDLNGGIALFMREGGHGITGSDWEQFLSFLAAKFTPKKTSAPVENLQVRARSGSAA